MIVTPDTLKEELPPIVAQLKNGPLTVTFQAASYRFHTILVDLEGVKESTDVFGQVGLLVCIPNKNASAIFLCHATPHYIKEKLGIPNDLCCWLFSDLINSILKEMIPG